MHDWYPWLDAPWQQFNADRTVLPHAIIINGLPGIGKQVFADRLVASVLCEQPDVLTRIPCGHCAACRWLQHGQHPDLRLLVPADTVDETTTTTRTKRSRQVVSIEQVRDLADFLHVGTHRQGWRVVLIRTAEALNASAANALLKSLEEPYPGTLFILVTNQLSALLPTIVSRCCRLELPAPSRANSLSWMKQHVAVQPEKWLALAQTPLLAKAWADNIADADLFSMIDAILDFIAHDQLIDSAHSLEKRLQSIKHQPLTLLVDLFQRSLFDLLRVCLGMQPRFLPSEQTRLKALASRVQVPSLLLAMQNLAEARRMSYQPLQERLFIEWLLLSISAKKQG